MRFLLLFVYLLAIIPHPDLPNRLCFSGGEPAYEGIHLPGGADQCEPSSSCDSQEHHSHDDCLDVDEKQISVSADISYDFSTILPKLSFQSIFATTPFRAPPVVYTDPINIPSRIGLILKSTAVILC